MSNDTDIFIIGNLAGVVADDRSVMMFDAGDDVRMFFEMDGLLDCLEISVADRSEAARIARRFIAPLHIPAGEKLAEDIRWALSHVEDPCHKVITRVSRALAAYDAPKPPGDPS